MPKTAVHKDFHGALSHALQHLETKYGRKEMEAYLRQLGRTVHKPLAAQLKRCGLKALEEHWRHIFRVEGGKIRIKREPGRLTLHVDRCPAIHHMLDHQYAIADHFCESTRIVNEEICKAAGYRASVEYDQANGRCVQQFWKDPKS